MLLKLLESKSAATGFRQQTVKTQDCTEIGHVKTEPVKPFKSLRLSKPCAEIHCVRIKTRFVEIVNSGRFISKFYQTILKRKSP